MFSEQDYAEGFPNKKREPKTLEEKQEAWSTARHATHFANTTDTAFKCLDKEAQTAVVYITALEQRISDLEKVLKIVSEPETRPSPLEELGHVRGLDVLQWLNANWRRDVADGIESDYAGIREALEIDAVPLECLVNRGYANRRQKAYWITVSGREYLKALKHDINK